MTRTIKARELGEEHVGARIRFTQFGVTSEFIVASVATHPKGDQTLKARCEDGGNLGVYVSRNVDMTILEEAPAPQPVEPTALGSVVEVDGEKWVRVDVDMLPWRLASEGDWNDWKGLAVRGLVTVLHDAAGPHELQAANARQAEKIQQLREEAQDAEEGRDAYKRAWLEVREERYAQHSQTKRVRARSEERGHRIKALCKALREERRLRLSVRDEELVWAADQCERLEARVQRQADRIDELTRVKTQRGQHIAQLCQQIHELKQAVTAPAPEVPTRITEWPKQDEHLRAHEWIDRDGDEWSFREDGWECRRPLSGALLGLGCLHPIAGPWERKPRENNP